MSKLEVPEHDINGGDLEDNGYSLLSEFEEHDESESDEET